MFTSLIIVSLLTILVPTASPPIRDLVIKVIQLNPADRLTAIECVNLLEKIPKSIQKINYDPPLPTSKQNEGLTHIAFSKELEIDSLISNLRELT